MVRTRSQPGYEEDGPIAPALRQFLHRGAGPAVEALVYRLSAPCVTTYCEMAQRALTHAPVDEALLLKSERQYRQSGSEARLAQTRDRKQRELAVAARDASKGGALRCPACGEDDINVQQKQTRSADEGMTVFCSCESCGRQWRMS